MLHRRNRQKLLQHLSKCVPLSLGKAQLALILGKKVSIREIGHLGVTGLLPLGTR